MTQYFPSLSVIIPVYNALDFIEQAVNSAVAFPEVGEVLIIDDGSTDGSYEVCKVLDQKFEKVMILSHKGRLNKGAAASRNLGILEASFPFIAFLDADDYFLPNRLDFFRNYNYQGRVFDGIYESIQYFNGSNKIYGMKRNILPQRLTHYLIKGTYGHFHTNGIIVKKDILMKAGLFVESLELHEDSDLWIKISYYGKLISGDLGKPVAMVRRHEGNRIWKGISNTSRLMQWKATWYWAWNKPIGIINKMLIIRKLLIYKIRSHQENKYKTH